MSKSAHTRLLFLISVFTQSPKDWIDVFSSPLPRIKGFPKRDKTIKKAVHELLASGRLEYKKVPTFQSGSRSGGIGDKETILIRLTEKSYKTLAKDYPFYRNYFDHWDKKYRLVVYNVSEKERAKRDAIRWILKSFHLRPIEQSFWITPHNISKEIIERLRTVNLEKYVKILEAEVNYGDFQSLWNIQSLNNKYRDLSQILEKTIKIIKLRRTRIDIFRRSFLVYQKLIKQDPGLPVELLPKDWFGVKVRKEFIRLQKLL